ncbi:histidinol-phosphate transaminase [Robertkochia sediminum]|uniref:histidinol-phosphate transaminase n=1 Tax=Robertkochia sediminum TaxID=2785326 RepID=UPI001933298D|nr:histidinol-phosphate transaminase [Robertkochia sediminum]MBL7473546.1 histidinol-phosphate transaminase [Robertkochia sediminum]
MKEEKAIRSRFDLRKLVRPCIAQLKPYRSARDEYSTPGGEMIFLDANENPYGDGINRYPDPYQNALKSVLASLKGVRPEQLIIGNGSDEVLDLLFRVFCEPGDANVITLPPTYGMYGVLAGVNNVEVREVPLDDQWQPRTDEILETVDDQTRMIFFCSPNNPTGNLMQSNKVKEILQAFAGIVVIDEAYIDFTSSDSWSSMLDDHPNLVVVQTLSKAYGLAGARVGFAIASEAIISILNKIKPPYNVNALSQEKALETLRDPEDAKRFLATVKEQKFRLIDGFKALDYVEQVFESEANFILFRVDDAQRRYDELLAKGIVVRKRHGLPGCDNTLRVSIGTITENEVLLTVLNQLN